MNKAAVALAALAVLVCLGSVACGGDDTGLSGAEVEEIVRDELADMPAPPAAESGVTAEEAERIARGVVASIPPRSAPADYTQFFVDNAISRYETQGRDATVAYYNRPDSVDGQWYVFIVDENDLLIAHPDPGRLGLDLKGWVGTDANRYRFGPEMLAADEAGRWVPYVYVNPAGDTLGDEGAFELKNAWVVRHDGLLFGSGWYINNEEFAPQLISESAEHFRRGGLEAILEFSNDPQGISAGLIPTVEYYNSTDTLDGYFTGFVAAPDGEILSHFDPRAHRNRRRGPAGPGSAQRHRRGRLDHRGGQPRRGRRPPNDAHVGDRRGRHPHRRRLVQRRKQLTRTVPPPARPESCSVALALGVSFVCTAREQTRKRRSVTD